MKHSEQFTAIAAALATAAGEFAAIQKNREVEVKTRSGGSYFFKYATLDGIVAAVRPALSKNGLVLVQSVVSEEITHATADGVRIEREELLETRLIHSSGEWFANTTPVLVSDGENSAQAYGSAITYARRYGITQLLCVVADEDDDGNAAAGNVARSRAPGSSAGGGGRGRGGAPISEKQAGMLRVKLKAIGGSEAGLCVLMKAESVDAILKSQMDDALAAIDEKVPELFEAPQGGAGNDRAAEAARRKEQHDEAVSDNEESLFFIRYHLGLERSDEVDLFAVEQGAGERNTDKAAAEWRALSADAQQALWLAPTKGGWFTTAERESLRSILASTADQKA